MASNLFIEGAEISQFIVLLGPEVIDGFDVDGAAITSVPLTEATAPVEGSGGYLCQGAAESDTHVQTWRVLRGSDGFRVLRRLAALGTTDTLSIRPRDLPLGSLDYDFYRCAYVVTSDGIGPNIDRNNKFATFTVYANGYRNNQVEVVA